MKVVAEGVEPEEQLMYLLSHGCDVMQGYYFSRPMAAEDFEALLVNRIEMAPLARPAPKPASSGMSALNPRAEN